MLNLSINPKLPKVIWRHILMKYLKLKTIQNVILNVKELNVLDEHSKQFLEQAKKGIVYNAKVGNLEVVKFLNENDVIVNNQAFSDSCEYGHIDIAKWLYSLGHIDISADNELVFRKSCDQGNLEVAKWISGLTNISSVHDFNFLLKHIHGDDVKISLWLISLRTTNIVKIF